MLFSAHAKGFSLEDADFGGLKIEDITGEMLAPDFMRKKMSFSVYKIEKRR